MSHRQSTWSRCTGRVVSLLVLASVISGVLAPVSKVEASAISISGTIRDQYGAPISGATVKVFNIGTEDVLKLEQTVTTGAGGTYSVPVGAFCFYVVVVSKPSDELLADSISVVAVFADAVAGEDIQLKPWSVKGKVVHSDKTSAAENAVVTAMSISPGYIPNDNVAQATGIMPDMPPTVFSRADGSYKLHIPEGLYSARATPAHDNPRDETPSRSKTLTITSNNGSVVKQENVDFVLQDPTVFGVLVDEAGDPIPLAYVSFMGDNGDDADTVTAQDGTFEITASEGVYDVRSYISDRSPYDIMTEWTQSWTFVASSPVDRVAFEVKSPNFRGTITSKDSEIPIEGAQVQVRSTEIGSFVQGSVGDDGRFGYFLEPGEYTALAVAPAVNPLGLGSVAKRFTIEEGDPVITERLILPSRGKPPYVMSRFASSVTKLCSDPTLDDYRDERVLGMSDDGSRVLVDTCDYGNQGPLHAVLLLSDTGDVLAEFPGATETAIISADGSTVAWTTNGTDYSEPSQTVSVATAPSWIPETTTIALPFLPYGNSEIALSRDGANILLSTAKENPELFSAELVLEVCPIEDQLVTCSGVSTIPAEQLNPKDLMLSTSGETVLFRSTSQDQSSRAMVFELKDGAWVNSVEVATADIAPKMSDDGRTLVWLEENGVTVGVRTRASESVSWSSVQTREPIDPERMGEGREIWRIELTGDGSKLFMVAEVGDLAFSIPSGYFTEIRRYTAPQLWRVDLESPSSEAAKLVSIDSDTKRPLEGMYGAYGDISSVFASQDGSSFVLSALISDAEQWPPTPPTMRMFRGVEASTTVYEFDDGAQISGVVGSTMISVSWPEASGKGVRYKVSRTPSGGTNPVITSKPAYVLTGLNPNTSYTVTVEAITPEPNNAVGDSLSKVFKTTLARSRSITAAVSAGGNVDFSWEAEPLGTKCEVRGTPTDDTLSEFTVSASGTTAKKSGLASASRWKVAAWCSIDGTATAITDELEFSIPAMSITSIGWTVPQSGRFATLGESISLTMVAEAARTGSVLVKRTMTDGDSNETTVALVESPSGTYKGTLSLTDTASIDEVTGTLADGDSRMVTKKSAQAKMSVEGKVKVAVTGPARIGWQLALSSKDGSLVRLATLSQAGAQNVMFSGLKQTKDVKVVLRTGSGEVVSQSSVVDVQAGIEQNLPIVAKALVDVVFTAVDDGGSPVAGLQISATDGVKFWQLITNSSGKATISGAASGSVITARAWPSDPFRMSVEDPDPISVGTEDVAVDLVLSTRQVTTIKGTVETIEGQPVSYASVIVVQRIGDLTFSRSGMTNADGTYSVANAYAGIKTEVMVSPAQAAPSTKSAIAVAPETVFDFSLDVPTVYMVPVKVYPSDSSDPLSLDWRTAVHLRMTAVVGERSLSPSNLSELPEGVQGGIMVVRGIAGEKLKACFDGVEGGDGKACGAVTLPSIGQEIPTLSVTLPPVYVVKATVNKGDGVPYQGWMNVFVQSADETSAVVWQGAVYGPNIEIPIESVGVYRIVANPLTELVGYSATQALALTVSSDRVTSLPSPLLLTRPSRFSSSENQITADRATVSPGSDVNFRAAWKNNGAQISEASAKVTIPAGTRLVTSSVMLGTTSIPSDSITLTGTLDSGQTANIPVGSIGAGSIGSLRWRLRTNVNVTSPAINGSVSLGSGSDDVALPSVVVPVAGVKLLAPASPAEAKFSVRGRAPVGSKVDILYDGAVLGRATASSTGSFVAEVVLPQRPDGTIYSLIARAVMGEVTLESDPARVRIDTSRVKTTFVCIRQQDPQRPDGRRYCFDSSVGVAAFPFVFVPWQMLQVEVFTDDPSRVESVRVWVGDQEAVAEKRSILVAPNSGLPLDAKRDAFVADFASVTARGEISLQVISRPSMPVVPALPAADEAVKFVPAEMLTSVPSTPIVTFENDFGGTFTQTLDLPESDRTNDMELEASFTGSNVGPTASEIAKMQSSGSLVWGFTTSDPIEESLPGGGKKVTRTVSFKMLTANIPNVSELRASSAGNASKQNVLVSALLKKAASVGLTQEVRFNITTNGEAAISASTGGGKYDSASDLLALIGDCVPNTVRSKLIARANALVSGAVAADALNSFIALGSLVAAPATFGTGTIALWAAGFAFGKMTDAMLQDGTDRLKADIEAENAVASTNPDCHNKPKRDPKAPNGSPIAKPTWIYDPSGYTFEGVTDNRVTGVTATLLGAPDVPEGQECPEVAAWEVVDMSPYDQTNPLITDEDGRYAWDVPEGCWKVQFTKDGYQTSYSAALKVLPPRLDVNVAMVRLTDPSAVSAALTGNGSIDISFDRLMSVNQSVESISLVHLGTGSEVSVEVSAVTPSPNPFGRQLASKYNAVPTTTLTPGASYKVLVSTDAVDYADRALGAGAQFTINVPAAPEPPTGPVNPPTPVNPPAPETPPAPVTQPAPATPATIPAVSTPTTTTTVSNTFKVNKSASRTSVLKIGKITAPSGSKVVMKVVSSSSKTCKVSGTSVKMLKAGTCKVAVTMTPKKGKVVKKTVTLKAVK